MSDLITYRILTAALTLFAHQGFHRTSLAHVASKAGISRGTLYARFRDKMALLAALADSMVTQALEAAEAAWVPGADLAANLEATILAKDLPLYRLLRTAPHGADLLAVDAALTRVQVERLNEGFRALLARRVTESLCNLAAFDGPTGFGDFLAMAGAGLKHEAGTEADYRAAVRRLSIIVARAATP